MFFTEKSLKERKNAKTQKVKDRIHEMQQLIQNLQN